MQPFLIRLKAELAGRVAAALGRCRDDGLLPPGLDLPPVALEVPKARDHGDLATSVALTLAKPAGRPPRRIAGDIIERCDLTDAFVDHVEVAGPGFINFHLDPRWLDRATAQILEADEAFGASDVGGGRRVQVEFVSANPTGPLVVVGARAAAVGDTLVRCLRASGYDVQAEYYVNDAGRQVELLGASLEARLRQELGEPAVVPEGGYPGEYLVDIARELARGRGRQLLDLPEGHRRWALAQAAMDRILGRSRDALAEYGVRFDVWFHEQSLHDAGAVGDTIDELRRRGHTFERDGALWFRSTAFGDDKDRVLVRQDGSPTYLAADAAYHRNKFARGFDQVLDIWGPDHHGYIARTRAAIAALGLPADRFEVLIVQVVRLLRRGEAVRMSKRGGEFVAMEDLLAEVGADAARFFFLMRSPDSHLDFDLDLAELQTEENPVYYVQYAHARIASVLRRAATEGAPVDGEPAFSRLTHETERALMRRLVELPEEVADAARTREVHRLTRYAVDVATLFHAFYTQCRILGVEPELSRARLALARATRTVLCNTLGLLGVSAPQRM